MCIIASCCVCVCVFFLLVLSSSLIPVQCCKQRKRPSHYRLVLYHACLPGPWSAHQRPVGDANFAFNSLPARHWIFANTTVRMYLMYWYEIMMPCVQKVWKWCTYTTCCGQWIFGIMSARVPRLVSLDRCQSESMTHTIAFCRHIFASSFPRKTYAVASAHIPPHLSTIWSPLDK